MASSKLRLIVMGQSQFAEKCLETILGNDAVEVIAVYTNPDTPQKPEPVKVFAESKGIKVYQHKSLKQTDDALKEWQGLNPDLVILAYVTQFVPDSMITVPRIGCVCFHPSVLPKYRGGSALQWQIINGEKKGGLSWFWLAPAAGSKVDDGPICVTAEVDISDDDTSASLYFNKIFPLGVQTCADVVNHCVRGDAPRIVQDESAATWDPLCNDKVAKIDWSKSADQVYNFIRGCDPQPGAFTFHGETQLRCFGAKLSSSSASSSSSAGSIVEVNDKGISVVCGDGGAVLITKAKGSGAKISAAEYAASNNLQVGTQLG